MSEQHTVEVGYLPVPNAVRSLLIYGGSFDPPHLGHLKLPGLARDRLRIDWLVYMPAKRSPFKEEAPSASDAQRLEMLQAGLAGADRTSVSTIELGRDPIEPSYTIDSLRAIRQALEPEVQLRLLIGEDQMRQFHRWKDAPEIIALAEPAVMLRADAQASHRTLIESMGGSLCDPEIERWGERIVELPKIEASASRIRELLALGRLDDADLRRMIPDSVLAIIDRDGLYSI